MARRPDPRSAQARLWSIVIAAGIVVTVLAFSSQLLDVTGLPKLLAVAVTSGGLLAVALRHTFSSDPIPMPSTSVLVAAAVIVAAFAVSLNVGEQTVRGAYGGYGRWSGGLLYLCVFLAFVAASVAGRDARSRRVLTAAIAAAGTVVALYSVLQWAGIDPVAWSLVYRDKSIATLGNPNFASAFLGISTPFVLAMLARLSPGRLRWAGVGAGSVLLATAMYSTGSLLGPFAAVVGIASAAVIWSWSEGTPRLRRIGSVVAAGGLAGGSALLGGWITGVLTAPDQVAIRLYYWGVAARMWLDHPLAGVGVGRFDDFFREYRTIDGLREFGTSAIADNPHSVAMTLLSEGGLLLVVPFVAVVGFVARRVYISATSIEADPVDRRDLVLFGGAWVGALAQSMVNFDVPPLALATWVIAGSAVAIGDRTAVGSVQLGRSLRIAVGVGAGVLAVALPAFVFVQARADADAANALGQEMEAPLAASEEMSAVSWDAWWEPRYAFEAARLRLAAGDSPGATEQMSSAAERFPRNWEVVVGAARLGSITDRVDLARRWYDRALEIDPIDPRIRIEYAEFLADRGSVAEAIALTREALAVLPRRSDWEDFLEDLSGRASHGELSTRLERSDEEDAERNT